jgi:hypothetical protein
MDRKDQPIDPATSKVRVNSERCKSCIFWTDGRSAVSPDRAREVIDWNLQADAVLTCHATIDTSAPAVCAGYRAKHRNDVLAGRIAQIFNGIIRVKPPGE